MALAQALSAWSTGPYTRLHPGISAYPHKSLPALSGIQPSRQSQAGQGRSALFIVPITLVITLVVTGFLSVPPLSSMLFLGRVHVLFVSASLGLRSDT